MSPRSPRVLSIVGLITASVIALLAAHAPTPSPALAADQGWYPQSTISSSNTIYGATFTDANNGWAAGSNGGLFFTHDGGQTWSTKVTSIADDLKRVAFPDAQDGYVAGDNVILHTADGGSNYQTLRSAPNGISSLSAPSASTVYVTANPNNGPTGVYKSTDGGASWQTVLTGTVQTVLFVTPLNGWIVDTQTVSHTVDGGQTWQTVFNGSGPYSRIAFANPSTGYLVGSNGWQRTTDGGASWTMVSSPSSSCYDCSLNSLAFISASQGLAGFSSGDYDGGSSINATGDGASTWQNEYDNRDSTETVAVGYRGTTPYAVINGAFDYYGYPAPPTPTNTSTPTNTPYPTDTATSTSTPYPTDMPTSTSPPYATRVPVATATPYPTNTATSPKTPAQTTTTALLSKPTATKKAGHATTPIHTVTPADTVAPTDTLAPVITNERARRPVRRCRASNLQQVVACVQASVLRVDIHLSDSEVQGSAFVVRSDNTGTYLLTNKHVVEGATLGGTRIIAPNGHTTYRVLGIQVGAGKAGSAGDLAIIRLARTTLRPLAFSTSVSSGQTVASIGYGLAFQLGGAPSVTEGIVSAVGRDLGDGSGSVWIQHQSTINQGNSGGPLLDMQGDVVGVNTLSIDQLPGDGGASQTVQGAFFAIPASIAQGVADRLIGQIQHLAANQLRAASPAASRLVSAGFAVSLPGGWIVNRLHRDRPVVLSRDQLVQVSLRSLTLGRHSVPALQQQIRHLAQASGRIKRLSFGQALVGTLHGVKGTATYKGKSYQLTVITLLIGKTSRVFVLEEFVQAGATAKDMRQSAAVVASLRSSSNQR